MAIYTDRCSARYTLGAGIMFLICSRIEGHDGIHWDGPLEVAWDTTDPAPDAHAIPVPLDKWLTF